MSDPGSSISGPVIHSTCLRVELLTDVDNQDWRLFMNTEILYALIISVIQNVIYAVVKAFDVSLSMGSEAALCPCLLTKVASRPRRSLRMRFSLIPVVLAGLFSATYAHAGAVCQVTSIADSGAGTLRNCITSGFGYIQITATGTITLNSALPTLTSSLSTFTITGPGANKLTVSGNNLYRVFNISSGSTSILRADRCRGKCERQRRRHPERWQHIDGNRRHIFRQHSQRRRRRHLQHGRHEC